MDLVGLKRIVLKGKSFSTSQWSPEKRQKTRIILNCIAILAKSAKLHTTALGKGSEKKIRISYGLLPNPPPDPPPGMVFLRIKKFTPIFFLEIESMIAKTNFTLGPIEKFIFFVKL